MTHPAAYELCQELYDLSSDGISGWGEDSRDVWRNNLSFDGKDSKIEVREREFTPRGSELCPAYTIGYLLRKLPTIIQDAVVELTHGDEGWAFGYVHSHAETRNGKSLWVQRVDHKAVADIPEDAACKLAIELWKQGILKL